MTLHIKNMVCKRCILAIDTLLKTMNITPISIRLGEVLLNEKLTKSQLNELKKQLENLGFELLDNQQEKIIGRIKSIIISQIQEEKEVIQNFSEILSLKINKDYSYISKLFSSTEGITIEQYIILQKIEKVKELLVYNELNVSEIAFKLNYSSVAHLSSQFKKVTGFTPSQFKMQGIHLRKPLDAI